LSSAPSRVSDHLRVRDLTAAVVVRGRHSAVWPLTAAFALPLFLGLAVLMGGAYALILRADVAAAQTAAANDAELVQEDIKAGVGYSTFDHAVGTVVEGRIYAQNPKALVRVGEETQAGDAKATLIRPPVTTFYRLVQHSGGRWRILEGDRQARLLVWGCAWWSPPDWGQCLGARPGAHATHWAWIATSNDPDWGVAETLDVTRVGEGLKGVDIRNRPPTVVWVGRKFALGEVRAGILGLAGWTLAAAGLAALALGLLVSLSMLRRIEAVNQVCDRVMRGTWRPGPPARRRTTSSAIWPGT
jgi:hypothetical protein